MVGSVVINGGGLAGWLCAATLRRSLDPSLAITVVERDSAHQADALYGSVLPPAAYDLHLGLGLGEPELMLRTQTTFVYGTAFEDWAETGRSWVQAFHAPLPVMDGIALHQIALRKGGLQPALISAQAARRGVFAHPPDGRDTPLSRAEYGYAVDLNEMTSLYREIALRNGVTRIAAGSVSAIRNGDRISALTLDNGETLRAAFYIDASGPKAVLSIGEAQSGRPIAFRLDRVAGSGPAAPAAHVTSDADGWTQTTRLRTQAQSLRITGSIDREGYAALKTGGTDTAWAGNCVAIGQAAICLEPLSVAPMKLLFADIARLVSLFPQDAQMSVEAREYNSAYRDDRDHALIFHQAHFADVALPVGSYWQDAAAERHPKLERKLTQYAQRGYLAAYDYELFDKGDWAVLHDGIGRRPARADALARSATQASDARYDELCDSIAQLSTKMPPHPAYLSKFLAYLQRKHA